MAARSNWVASMVSTAIWSSARWFCKSVTAAGGREVGPDTACVAAAALWTRRMKSMTHARDRHRQVCRRHHELPDMRGKVLGGSTLVNGMVWVKGQPADYEALAAQAGSQWNSANFRAPM